MTALYELDLVTPTARLLEDLGALSAVAVLGFTGASAQQTAAALERVAADRRWTFVDLRAAPPKAALDAPVLVVATTAKVTGALATRIADIIDGRAAGKPRLVVLCESVSNHRGLPPELRRVPYSEFMPAP